MEQDKNTPFSREPWQRLLQDRADAPSETTDARIRAAARKALSPRAARWWLPASLAASFLLAVLLVQWQYDDSKPPAVVSESDLAAPAVRESAVTDESRVDERTLATPRAEAGLADEEFAPEPDSPRARIGGPEQDLKAASEVPAEESSEDAPTSAMDDSALWMPAPTVADSADAPVERERQAEAKQDAPLGENYAQAAAKIRSPDAWYADIKALRNAGRNEAADVELARFEAAYPDWLKERDLPRP